MAVNSKTKGFSLVEMVLAVGVTAIVITIAFPQIIEMINFQRERQEQSTMREIKRAMTAYAKQNRVLPDDSGGPTDWADELATVSSLSPEALRRDTFRNQRAYRAGMVTEFFRGQPLDVWYATVFSAGINGVVDTAGVPANGQGRVILGNNVTWWDRPAPDMGDYAAMVPDGDDVIIKHNTQKIMTELYLETLERMRTFAKAVESYARNKYATALSINAADRLAGVTPTYPNIEDEIFYPPVRTGDYQANVGGEQDLYNQLVKTGTLSLEDNQAPQNTVKAADMAWETSTGDDATRLIDMTDLARMLGLPDEFCCHAITGDPFYYYSNPAPDDGAGGCLARPTSPPYLPPRVTVNPDPCG